MKMGMKKRVQTLALLLILFASFGIQADQKGEEAETTITFYKDEVSVDDSIVTVRPDTRVKRSTYYVYHFSKKDFEEKLGPLSELPVKLSITIRINKEEKYNRHPNGKDLSVPEGGFRYIIYSAKVQSRVE